jgi:outer membrane protein assembly factor BamA
MANSVFGRDLPSMLIQESMQRTLGLSTTLTKSLGNNFSATLGLTGQNTSLTNGADAATMQTLFNSMQQRALTTGLTNDPNQATAIAMANRATQLKGGTYMSVSPGLAYDTRDAAIDPSRGTLAKLNTTPSLGLGNASFMKMGASISQFVPIDKSTTLALNVQGGSALGGMPQFAQYNLGGWNGMRGYQQFSSLGTGSSMLMATAEVRRNIPFLHSSRNKVAQTIDKHVKFAVFCDAGQVGGNDVTNSLMSRSNMGASVGIGLRFKLPMVGMIRVDYGFPLLSTVLGGYKPQFTFGFGEKF